MRTISRTAVVALCGGLEAFTLGGCGTPLVGEACAPGYHVVGAVCAPVAQSSGTSMGAGGADSGTAMCPTGLSTCDRCVDLQSDPQNCGMCHNACVGGACIAGTCTTGAVAPGAIGHAVVLGLDFSNAWPGDSSAQLLGNAVFLTAHNPVRILDYRELTTWNASAVTNTVDLIADEAVARGRAVVTSVAPHWTDVPVLLASRDFDVLFVHSLDTAPSGSLATVGAAWAASLLSFSAHGGVVVALATPSGTDQMQELLTSTAILSTSGVVSAGATPLTVPGTADAIGAGLPSTLPPIGGAASFVTNESPAASLAFIVESGSAPVVVHRAWY